MSVFDGDRLIEDGGKVCGDASHRLYPEEDFAQASNEKVSGEKLGDGLYGCKRPSRLLCLEGLLSENCEGYFDEKKLGVVGDISHRFCPEEEVSETGNGYIDEEELDVVVDGHIVTDGVAGKSYREEMDSSPSP